jgi:hypothetical protein
MAPKTRFEKAIEREVGDDIDTIAHMPIDERRRLVEQRHGGKRMTVVSKFPLIGRGNVLGDCLISHEEVEKELEKAIR